MIFNYTFSKDNTKIIFTFNPKEYHLKNVTEVYVTGPFSMWKINKDYRLNPSDKNTYSKSFDYNKINVPGNTGLMEYKFAVTVKSLFSKSKTIYLNAPEENTGFKFYGNNLVIPPQGISYTRFRELIDLEKETLRVVYLKEFDLTKQSDIARISNVRLVPGTKNLWRGYHPYKKSRPFLDTENKRIFYVNEQLKQNHIQSVITLSGNESLNSKLKEKIYPVMKEIQDKNNQCFINTSYETVYFDSKSNEYNECIRKICAFIIEHPAPFYIHCRLGSDRTGTMSSILAALCGASWKDIAEDYCKTSLAGIHEYRSSELLANMFKTLLLKHPKDITNLQEELSSYFVKNNILTQEQINLVIKKLK